MAEKRATELIERERRVIEAEAQVEAEVIAKEGLKRFMDQGAASYRDEVRKTKAARLTALEVTKAKLSIRREEGALGTAPDTPELDFVSSDREQIKQRAKELRSLTSKSHMLALSALRPQDSITLCFTDRGMGMEPLTEYDNWGSSRYRTELENRKIVCEVLDPETGYVEIKSDSWLTDPSCRDRALRGGRQCIISAMSPETGQYEPTLVKAGTVMIDPLEGNPFQMPEHDLWWVNLGEFRALS